ncbi:hypothetical protein [Streptomyces sp. NPDC047525]|uniref:hypothetical protein n=1 Tax=Streptomyces sp. NPDC047525 TaxID=3155264 RepID=UPI0033C7DC6C
MAEAKRTTLDKVVTETKKVPAITLTLTVEEAEVLAVVGAFVGGDPDLSARKHYQSVSKALRTAGVRTYGSDPGHPMNQLDRERGTSVYFKTPQPDFRLKF